MLNHFKIILLINFCIVYKTWALNLKIITIATEETDGFLRLQKSAKEFEHDLIVFGLGEEWNGGNMRLNTVTINLINIKYFAGRCSKNTYFTRKY